MISQIGPLMPPTGWVFACVLLVSAPINASAGGWFQRPSWMASSPSSSEAESTSWGTWQRSWPSLDWPVVGWDSLSWPSWGPSEAGRDTTSTPGGWLRPGGSWGSNLPTLPAHSLPTWEGLRPKNWVPQPMQRFGAQTRQNVGWAFSKLQFWKPADRSERLTGYNREPWREREQRQRNSASWWPNWFGQQEPPPRAPHEWLGQPRPKW